MGLINFLKQKFSKHKDEKPSEAAAPSQKEEPKKEEPKRKPKRKSMPNMLLALIAPVSDLQKNSKNLHQAIKLSMPITSLLWNEF